MAAPYEARDCHVRGLNVGCPLPHLAVVGIGLVAKWQLMLLTVTLRNSIQLLDK